MAAKFNLVALKRQLARRFGARVRKLGPTQIAAADELGRQCHHITGPQPRAVGN